MRLLEHQVLDFRNLEHVEVDLCEKLTVLLGANGQGKTSFLESIYFLSTQRGLRNGKLSELLRHGSPGCSVKARVRGEISSRLHLVVRDGRRQASVDEKRERSLTTWATHLPVVAFTPDDLILAKGGPGERRQWIDRVVFARHPTHLDAIRRYRRAVASRNRLLRDAAPGLDHALASFDPLVASAGAEVIHGRRALVRELQGPLERILEKIVGVRVSIALHYRSSAEGNPGAEEVFFDGKTKKAEVLERLRETFMVSLQRHQGEDRARRRTCVGPHVDEVEIDLQGHPLRAFGSQGQQRSVVLALKIAEIENLKERADLVPLLLLDDISSELDPSRNAHLLDYLQNFSGQAILTTTDLSHLSGAALSPARVFDVKEGRISPRP